MTCSKKNQPPPYGPFGPSPLRALRPSPPRALRALTPPPYGPCGPSISRVPGRVWPSRLFLVIALGSLLKNDVFLKKVKKSPRNRDFLLARPRDFHVNWKLRAAISRVPGRVWPSRLFLVIALGSLYKKGFT